MDTMSLHVCIAGQTAAQKVIWQKVRLWTFGSVLMEILLARVYCPGNDLHCPDMVSW